MVDHFYYQNVLYVVVKKSKFVKEQKAKGLLRSLGLKTPSSKVPLLGEYKYSIN